MTEAFAKQPLGTHGDTVTTSSTCAKERWRPRPLPRLDQTSADLSERYRHLLREPLHELPQLVTLGAHTRQPTAGHLDGLVGTLIECPEAQPTPHPAPNQLAPVTRF